MESHSLTQYIAEDLGGAECANIIDCANAAISRPSKVVVHDQHIAAVQLELQPGTTRYHRIADDTGGLAGLHGDGGSGARVVHTWDDW